MKRGDEPAAWLDVQVEGACDAPESGRPPIWVWSAGQSTESSGGVVAQGPNYVVLQVVLKEKFLGTGSGNLTELEKAINEQAAKGYRLHTISTVASGSKGFGGGDRVQATMVFEAI